MPPSIGTGGGGDGGGGGGGGAWPDTVAANRTKANVAIKGKYFFIPRSFITLDKLLYKMLFAIAI